MGNLANRFPGAFQPPQDPKLKLPAIPTGHVARRPEPVMQMPDAATSYRLNALETTVAVLKAELSKTFAQIAELTARLNDHATVTKNAVTINPVTENPVTENAELPAFVTKNPRVTKIPTVTKNRGRPSNTVTKNAADRARTYRERKKAKP